MRAASGRSLRAATSAATGLKTLSQGIMNDGVITHCVRRLGVVLPLSDNQRAGEAVGRDRVPA